MSDSSNSNTEQAQTGRNEPCPCGSGKKYKRCCGVSAAPRLTPPKQPAAGEGLPSLDQFDPEWISGFSKMMQRLPRGQVQKLQAIMQRAMSGKDVTAEAEAFQKTLPLDMQDMLAAFKMPGAMAAAGMQAPASPASGNAKSGMTEEEARAIVAAAASEGKISAEKADELLGEKGNPAEPGKKGIGKLWQNISGKKS